MIVKVGGSVVDKLKIIFETLERVEEVKVIPGGWIFSDIVEKMNLSEEISHWMAVLSMNLYGYYMFSYAEKAGFEILEPEEFGELRRRGRFIVLPYKLLKNFDELPHSWDVTSDSISIWIASKIGEKKVFKVTAVGGVLRNGYFLEFAKAEESIGVIDRYSPVLIKNHGIELFICSPEELKNYILRGRARGTFVRGD
ncbi:MAG: uridylate kinase [Archaeoglobaceae archaeon]|nr:uridylate kinase [Archaeoglobaceae archaeon]MDW7989454.1 uridylate kinase [Archaeoglobaceae archaeon]